MASRPGKRQRTTKAAAWNSHTNSKREQQDQIQGAVRQDRREVRETGGIGGGTSNDCLTQCLVSALGLSSLDTAIISCGDVFNPQLSIPKGGTSERFSLACKQVLEERENVEDKVGPFIRNLSSADLWQLSVIVALLEDAVKLYDALPAMTAILILIRNVPFVGIFWHVVKDFVIKMSKCCSQEECEHLFCEILERYNPLMEGEDSVVSSALHSVNIQSELLRRPGSLDLGRMIFKLPTRLTGSNPMCFWPFRDVLMEMCRRLESLARILRVSGHGQYFPVVTFTPLSPASWWQLDEQGRSGMSCLPESLRCAVISCAGGAFGSSTATSALRHVLIQIRSRWAVQAMLSSFNAPDMRLEKVLHDISTDLLSNKWGLKEENPARTRSTMDMAWRALGDIWFLYSLLKRIEPLRCIRRILDFALRLRGSSNLHHLLWLVVQPMYIDGSLSQRDHSITLRTGEMGVMHMMIELYKRQEDLQGDGIDSENLSILKMSLAAIVLRIQTKTTNITDCFSRRFPESVRKYVDLIHAWRSWAVQYREDFVLSKIELTPEVFRKIVVVASAQNTETYTNYFFDRLAGRSHSDKDQKQILINNRSQMKLAGNHLVASTDLFPYDWIYDMPFYLRLRFQKRFVDEIARLSAETPPRAFAPSLVESYARFEESMPWTSDWSMQSLQGTSGKPHMLLHHMSNNQFSPENFTKNLQVANKVIAMQILLELVGHRLFARFMGTCVPAQLFTILSPRLEECTHRELFSSIYVVLHKILTISSWYVLAPIVNNKLHLKSNATLNRCIVLAIVRACCADGPPSCSTFENSAVPSKDVLLDFLKSLQQATPLEWSSWTLESFPPEASVVRDFFQNVQDIPIYSTVVVDGLAKNEGLLMFSSEQQCSSMDKAWQTKVAVFSSNNENRRAFLAVIVYHILRSPIVAPKVLHVMKMFKPWELAECSKGIIDYIVHKFSGISQLDTYKPHLVSAIKQLIWTYQIIRFDVLIFDLTRSKYTVEEQRDVTLAFLRELLLSEFDEKVKEALETVKEMKSMSDSEWATKFNNQCNSFPEYSNFEALGDINQVQGLPKYYGNFVTSMIPALYRLVVYVLELPTDTPGRLPFLSDVVEKYSDLYHVNDMRISEYVTLLRVYHHKFTEESRLKLILFPFFVSRDECKANFSANFVEYVTSNGNSGVDWVSEEYLGNFLKKVAESTKFGGLGCRPHALPASPLRPLLESVIELLMLPKSCDTIVEAMKDIVCDNPSAEYINAFANILSQFPVQPTEEILCKSVRQVIEHHPLLQRNGLGYFYCEGNVGDIEGRLQSKPRVLCILLHALWMYDHAQRERQTGILEQIFLECSCASEHQLLYMCHLLGPFFKLIAEASFAKMLVSATNNLKRLIDSHTEIKKNGQKSMMSVLQSCKEVIIYLRHLIQAYPEHAGEKQAELLEILSTCWLDCGF
eukprot:m.184314 g.184314  ORF g.184314 m.184314 type:complete len:1440 (+) comp15558_c0_seq3:187-4506(+)